MRFLRHSPTPSVVTPKRPDLIRLWRRWGVATAALVLLLVGGMALGAESLPIPKITFGAETAKTPQEVSTSLQILLGLTLLALLPSLLVMFTSFTRIIIVLSLVRNALGTQQMPPNQVLVGLTLFLTFFVMQPVITEVYDKGYTPYMEEKITSGQALKVAEKSLRGFMVRQTRRRDLALFVSMAKLKKQPKTIEDVPTYVLMPAFLISELTTGFQLGFVIFLPFLVIDMVIASTLMAMGMMMLPPVMISLPFKLLIFVLVDGWNLLGRSLVLSFR